MEVILLEKMRNLGALGDKVKVKPGFARNYLIPQGKAVFANKANIEKFEQHRAELEKKAEERMQKSLQRQEELKAVSNLKIVAKAGEEGKLFGSVGTRDISEAFSKAGVKVEKSEIRMPSGTLRMVGEYDITVDLGSDVTAEIKLTIVGEG